MHYAASMSGAIDVMEALMASGADVNVINQDHSTPLMFACQSNNMYAASLLLANGASVRVKNLQGRPIEKNYCFLDQYFIVYIVITIY